MTRIYQVDAFTSEPFRGNPAAVCVLDSPVDSVWMQSVASEMNLAETAFLWPEGDRYRLRWFTPRVEVELCGHATLASSHILWERGHLSAEKPAVFSTYSGELSAHKRGDLIVLDFPSEPGILELDAEQIGHLIGVEAVSVWKNRFDMLVELASEDQVRGFNPDMSSISALDCRGLIVTSRSNNPRYHFVSRFFAPRVGIDEDPVTGSAHCFLGPFWGARFGTDTLEGYQASSRGGEVTVMLRGARVELAGNAITVLEGRLLA